MVTTKSRAKVLIRDYIHIIEIEDRSRVVSQWQMKWIKNQIARAKDE
jgi:hypothetical protein